MRRGSAAIKICSDSAVCNLNEGHEYATDLSDAARRALLEYLKSL